MESFFDLIRQRESCRSYWNQPVENEKLLNCLEAARLAPSACNGQPWHFTAVTDAQLVSKIAKCTQGMGMNAFVSGAPVLVVVQQEPSNLQGRLGGAVTKRDFSSIDIGLAVSQFCLAATEQGLGTCILGWFDEAAIQQALSANQHIRLVIALGYPDSQQPREKKRKDFWQIVSLR